MADVARKYGVSEKTIYAWRNKYGGLVPSEVARPRQLEDENRKLKQYWWRGSRSTSTCSRSLAKKTLRPAVRREVVERVREVYRVSCQRRFESPQIAS